MSFEMTQQVIKGIQSGLDSRKGNPTHATETPTKRNGLPGR
jgi:hypothetical protein